MMGSSGAKSTAAHEEPKIQGVRLNSSSLNKAVALIYGTNRVSGNMLWYGDFRAETQASANSTGGGKGGGGQGPTQTETVFYASFLFGLCDGVIGSVGRVWEGKAITSLSALGMSLFTGTRPTQTPWGYLTTNHPGQDLSYPGLCYVAASNMQLDSQGVVPNLSFEVGGPLQVGSGNVDSNPSVFILDYLTNTLSGVGMPTGQIGSLTNYSNYCVSHGLFLSPALETQEQAFETVQRWLDLTNSAFVWSDNSVKIIPFGDKAKTANGATYTPNLTPAYDLTDDDYIVQPGDDPVEVTRSAPSDAHNIVRVEYLDRAQDYSVNVAEAKDMLSIQTYGPRNDGTITAHEVTTNAVANHIAQLRLQRNLFIRNTYRFNVGYQYIRLDPMDLVTLTESTLGLNGHLVRITRVSEDDAGVLAIEAEDLLIGVSNAQQATRQTVAAGTTPDYQVDPGNADTPILICAPPILTAGNLEIWMATTGGANWGGCFVYVSSDGTTYNLQGKLTGKSRMGVLTAPLPSAAADPDTVNTCSVTFPGGATLISGTTGDADAYRTLCAVDDGALQELISFQTATLTSADHYNLTYLRRGIFDSTIRPHANGARFARMDSGTFRINYSENHLGNALYVKLQSFNQYGYGLQDLSAVPVTMYTITGPFVTQTPGSFVAKQYGGTVAFSWLPLTQWNARGYEIRYGQRGTSSWGTAQVVTVAQQGTEMTNASIPPGDWTFFIAGVNQAGQYSLVATSDLVVTSVSGNLRQVPQHPGWDGTLTNLYRHWTGVLVPLGTATNLTAMLWNTFDSYVYDPVASGTYDAKEIDQGFVSTVSALASIAYTNGPGVSGSGNVVFQIDWAGSDHVYTGSWTTWNGGTVTARYIKFRLLHTVGSIPVYLSSFTPQINNSQVTDGGGPVTILTGGTQVFFGRTFNAAPSVVPAAISSTTALFAMAYNITVSSFYVVVRNTSGTDVGGSINWSATGF